MWCLWIPAVVGARRTVGAGGGADAAVRPPHRLHVLAHICPAHSENINFFDAIEVDIDAELAALGPAGYRPLRVRDTLF